MAEKIKDEELTGAAAQIKEIEEELARTKYNKHTQGHIGKLKAKLACGGTVKDGVIELQGSHVPQVKQELIKLGFSAESIKT